MLKIKWIFKVMWLLRITSCIFSFGQKKSRFFLRNWWEKRTSLCLLKKKKCRGIHLWIFVGSPGNTWTCTPRWPRSGRFRCCCIRVAPCARKPVWRCTPWKGDQGRCSLGWYTSFAQLLKSPGGCFSYRHHSHFLKDLHLALLLWRASMSRRRDQRMGT